MAPRLSRCPSARRRQAPMATSKYWPRTRSCGTVAVCSRPSGAEKATSSPGPRPLGTCTITQGGLRSNSSPACLPGGTVVWICVPSGNWIAITSPTATPSGTLTRYEVFGPMRTCIDSPGCAPSRSCTQMGPCGPRTQTDRWPSARLSGRLKLMSTGRVHSARVALVNSALGLPPPWLSSPPPRSFSASQPLAPAPKAVATRDMKLSPAPSTFVSPKLSQAPPPPPSEGFDGVAVMRRGRLLAAGAASAASSTVGKRADCRRCRRAD
mmetsp:Transcript_86330/g.222340  ORF Transcript_86330/g.222340 Transcript_86330/m.222340 type:complete len:267 (+) Transcript_86330:105-905(+)